MPESNQTLGLKEFQLHEKILAARMCKSHFLRAGSSI